jgi:hypothetical protein
MKLLVGSVVVYFGLAATAYAQASRPERPYRGLFAGGVENSQQLLTISGSAGVAWDKNLVADFNGRNILIGDQNPSFQPGAPTGSAVISYSLSGARVGVGASLGSTARYYRRPSDRLIRREYANFGTSALLGRGVTAHAAAIYQPYGLKAMFPGLYDARPGDGAVIDEDFPDSNVQYLSYSGGLEFSRRISRRQTFSATYDYRGRAASDGLERYDGHTGGARLIRTLSRDLELRLGYAYSQAIYGRSGNSRFGNHQLDVGVNYRRSLSFSRRTTLSFGTGTSAAGSSEGDGLRYRATGTARLNHDIGRTWSAGLSYNRGLQFMEAWPEPVFGDSAIAGISGLVNSRTQVQLMARGLRGSGWQRASSDIRTFNGGATVTVAITRYISTGIAYAYYLHEFAGAVSLAPGFPNQFDGQTIRASVNLWAPLFQRARTP